MRKAALWLWFSYWYLNCWHFFNKHVSSIKLVESIEQQSYWSFFFLNITAYYSTKVYCIPYIFCNEDFCWKMKIFIFIYLFVTWKIQIFTEVLFLNEMFLLYNFLSTNTAKSMICCESTPACVSYDIKGTINIHWYFYANECRIYAIPVLIHVQRSTLHIIKKFHCSIS